MSNELLIYVVGAMWSVLFAVGGFWLKRISDKLDLIFEHREQCVRDFADRARNDAAHKEFYDRLAVHSQDITRLSARVDALER
ncbi:hypothetical protein [Mailhella sp.]